MTTEFVQSRRNPPVLIPLKEPERLPRPVILERITLIYCLVATKRELDKIEEKELETLFTLISGSHNPKLKAIKHFEEELLS
jgi:hypothetical protein